MKLGTSFILAGSLAATISAAEPAEAEPNRLAFFERVSGVSAIQAEDVGGRRPDQTSSVFSEGPSPLAGIEGMRSLMDLDNSDVLPRP